MSSPGDRTLLKITAHQLRERADLLDQIAGEFNEMARLNEALGWCRVRLDQEHLRAGRSEAYYAFAEMLNKLRDLQSGK